MRERLTEAFSVNLTPTQAKKIRKAAEEFGARAGEIIRECIEKEIDRLIDRERKRRRTASKS